MEALERVVSGVEVAFCQDFAPSAALPILLGKIKIKQKLGEGACAIVYKAYLGSNKVAVKVYKPNNAHVCRQEASLLAKMKHRHIVDVLGLSDHVQPGTGFALVMEYMDAGSLFRIIAQQMIAPHTKLYTDDQALEWSTQLASAVESLHLRSPAVAHRDLKQENVLLKKENGKLIAKLIDFSLTTELLDTKLCRDDTAGTANGFESTSTDLYPPAAPASGILLLKENITAMPSMHVECVDDHTTATLDASTSSTGNITGQTSTSGFTSASTFSGYSACNADDYVGNFADSIADDSINSIDTFCAVDQNPGTLCVDTTRVPYSKWWTHEAGQAVSSPSASSSGTSLSCSTRMRGNTASSEYSMCSSTATSVYNLTGKTGSYTYMAPEVFRNEKYNEKGDVFSFGVMVYELFTRELLVYTMNRNGTDGEIEEFARRVSTGFRPPPSKRIPTEIWELIQLCWHHDPMQRPSISEVRAALLSFSMATAARKIQSQQLQSRPGSLATLALRGKCSTDDTGRTQPPQPQQLRKCTTATGEVRKQSLWRSLSDKAEKSSGVQPGVKKTCTVM